MTVRKREKHEERFDWWHEAGQVRYQLELAIRRTIFVEQLSITARVVGIYRKEESLEPFVELESGGKRREGQEMAQKRKKEKKRKKKEEKKGSKQEKGKESIK